MKSNESWRPTKVARGCFQALKALGGEAFNSDVAIEVAGWATWGSNNGVSVSLGALCDRGYVEKVKQNGNNPLWRIVKELP